MKLITLSLLFFLTFSAFAGTPEKRDKVKSTSTEAQVQDQNKKAEQTPSVMRPFKKQRIPDQLDLFLPVVTNKYEPTA